MRFALPYVCCLLLSYILKFGLIQSWVSWSVQSPSMFLCTTSTVWCLKQPHCFLLNVNYSIVHHAYLRLPLEHTCLCILWSLFSKQSWAQTKKHVHPPGLPRLNKSIWFQCNTIQLWWLKLYVHRQNRIIHSQTHMLDVSAPQISLSNQFWFQKPGQLPFVVAKTSVFSHPSNAQMHTTPKFLPCQVRGKFLQVLFSSTNLWTLVTKKTLWFIMFPKIRFIGKKPDRTTPAFVSLKRNWDPMTVMLNLHLDLTKKKNGTPQSGGFSSFLRHHSTFAITQISDTPNPLSIEKIWSRTQKRICS